MLDKNGMEIKTGMVVEIKDAFFKNDNGLYFVEHSAGDPDWCGSDHSLRKISKRGKISQAKHNLCFWPIGIFISDRFKAAEARTWNKEHATIERRHFVSCFAPSRNSRPVSVMKNVSARPSFKPRPIYPASSNSLIFLKIVFGL